MWRLTCLFLLLVHLKSAAGRSIDNTNNSSQYDCYTDDTCADRGNVRILNNRVYCCQDDHTIIFKLEIGQANTFGLFFQDDDAIETTEHLLGQVVDGQSDPIADQSSEQHPNHRSSHGQDTEETHHQASESAPYTIQVNREQPAWDPSPPRNHQRLLDNHFPTSIYLDLREDTNEGEGRLARRNLRRRNEDSGLNVIRREPTESKLLLRDGWSDEDEKIPPRSPPIDEEREEVERGAGRVTETKSSTPSSYLGEKRLPQPLRVKEERPTRRTIISAVCMCDRSPPMSFSDFIQSFLRSLCTMKWFH